MRLYFFIRLIICVILIIANPVQVLSAEFSGTFRYGPIPTEYLEKALTSEPVLVQLNEGETFNLQRLNVSSKLKSTFISGISADFMYVAVIDGELRSDDITIRPGEVIFTRPGSLAKKSHFDANKTLNSLYGSLPVDVTKLLEEIVKKQRRKVFWGIYRNSGINLQASTPTGIELQRRTYLSNPQISNIRFSDNDIEMKAKLVAEQFAIGLKRKNLEALSEILHPGIFMNPNEFDLSDKALARRYDYAMHLVNSPKLKNHRHYIAQIHDGGWQIEGLLFFKIKIADGFPFVDKASIKFAE